MNALLSGDIVTLGGDRVPLLNPFGCTFEINDIARSLGNECRYNGHVSEFYSVAQHSCLLALYAYDHPEYRVEPLRALLHDASEAYLKDLPRPLKRLIQASGYGDLEESFTKAIGDYLNIDISMTPELKTLDNRICIDENLALGRDHMNGLCIPEKEPLGVDIQPWPPAHAARMFLAYYNTFREHGI